MSSTAKTGLGRLLALDLGDKRIGVAVSDELRISISPQPSILVTNWKAVLENIRRAIADFDAVALVIGWPINMDGSEGDRVAKVRATAAKLQKSVEIPLLFQDERLSSEGALDILRETGVPKAQWAALVDSQAAAIILYDFVSRVSNGSSGKAEPTIY